MQRRRILIGLILLAAVATTADLLAASTVRGRLVRRGPYGEHPAGGIGVTLYAATSKIGRSPMSYTGSDGMYYIPNVPGGRYKLEVWVSSRPWVYDITVYEQQFTDIAQIIVP